MGKEIVLLVLTLLSAMASGLDFMCDMHGDVSIDSGLCCLGAWQNMSCIDGGVGLRHIGGNFTVKLIEAKNLPQMDSFGPASGETDPYVKIRVGNSYASSDWHPNSNNPDFNHDPINLGFRRSGEFGWIELWDKDTGMEFEDDLLVKDIRFNVPYCSMTNDFAARPNRACADVAPGEPCFHGDSAWESPHRNICNETAWVSLDGGDVTDCEDEGRTCLRVLFELVPLTATIEFSAYNLDFTVAADRYDFTYSALEQAGYPWAANYGYLHTDVDATYTGPNLDDRNEDSKALQGALVMRTPESLRHLPYNEEVARVAINFDSMIYVCRELTNDIMLGSLTWMNEQGYEVADEIFTTKDYRGYPNTITTNRRCYKRFFEATKKNKYGLSYANVIDFGGNWPKAQIEAGSNLKPRKMYTVFIVPRIGPAPFIPEVDFDYSLDISALIFTFIQFGIMFGVTFYFTEMHLSKNLNYRLDRIETFLVTRTLTGTEKNVIHLLFASYMLTENNVEFRRNLYYAKMAVKVAMMTPFVILWAWGMAAAAIVNPPAVGFAIMFVGTAALLVWYGFKLWTLNNWRMSSTSLYCLGGSFLCVLVYAVATAFVDPAVLVGGKAVDFIAISVVFGTLNVMPLLAMAFLNDNKLRRSAKQLIMVIEASADKMPGVRNAVGWHGKGSAFNKIMGGVWSVFDSNSPPVTATIDARTNSVPANTAPQSSSSAGASMFDVGADVTKSSFLANSEKRGKLNKQLYQTSVLVLVAYVVACVFFTELHILAILNSVSLILIDGIHVSLSHGNTNWSPGYQAFLMCVARLAVMSTGEDNWLAGYSVTYFVYGVALSREIVRKHLPTLTEQVASGVAYYGYDAFPKFKGDISGSPDFCLGLMSFLFVLLMAFCTFGTLPLPMVDVEIGGLCPKAWPSYVFGTLAFLLVLTFCLAIATKDAVYLASRHLLSGNKGKSFLFSKQFRLPAILGLLTETLVIVTGLFVYAATECTSMFTLSVFCPLIVAVGGYVYSVWVENDFEIVIWPPLPPDFDVSTEEDEDQLVANMLGDLFGAGGDDDVDKEMFKLPPLMKTGAEIRGEVKMPPMPLKSALKHKQQQELKQQKEAQKPQKALVAGGSIEGDTLSLGTSNTAGSSLMEFDDSSVATGKELEEMEDGGEDGVEGAVKLLEVRNKFVHQRVNILNIMHEATQKYSIMKPIGYIGSKFMAVWRKTPCGKPRSGYKKKKKADAGAADGAITDSIGQGGDSASGGAPEDAPGGQSIEELMALTTDTGGSDAIVYEEVNYDEMSLFDAAMGGYLLMGEYYALLGFTTFFLLIFLMGLVISLSDGNGYVGHMVWCSFYVLVFTAAAFKKYFSTFGQIKEDRTLSVCTGMAGLVLVGFCALVFVVELKGEMTEMGGLILLNALVLYPTTVVVFFKLYAWADGNWVITNIDEDGDGRMTLKELLTFFGFAPVAVFLFFIFCLELYIFADPFLATSVLLLLFFGLIGVIFLRDWAQNDFWLTEKYQSRADWLINGLQVAAICGAILFGTESRMYCLSLFFLFYMMECAGQVAAAYVTMEAEEPIYFSPFLLPVYSFSAATDDLKDETANVIWFFKLLIAGCAWGVTLAMFVSPLSYGVVITCLFLLSIVVCVATCLGHVPLQLGETARYVSKGDVVDSAMTARGKFFDRQKPVEIYDPTWEGKTFKNEWDEEEDESVKLMEKDAFDLATTVETNIRSCTFVEEKGGKRRLNLDGEDGDLLFKEDGTVESSTVVADIPPRADGLWTWQDAFAESLITGQGPFGFVGLFGVWYKVFFACSQQRFCYHSKIIAKYDSKGARKTVAKSEGSIDSRKIIKDLPGYDAALDKRFGEEMRAVIYFMLMLVNSCDARLKHQKVNFQKFLRENRFKLLSNGIKPPKDIFGGGGNKSNIDVALVATWLSSLTPEERERFHMLRMAFNSELSGREKESDRLDEQRAIAAESLRDRLKVKEEENCAARYEKLKVLRANRLENWKRGQLDDAERVRFRELQIKWMGDPNCAVDAHDAKLRQKFEQYVMVKTDEGTLEARNFLREVESGDKYCRPGKSGRMFQFHDPDFPSNSYSVGLNTACRGRIKEWRESIRISSDAVIFDGGTDPDDVRRGGFSDGWLLSAISMLAAAGGVDDGGVDAQISNLFVSHVGVDGQPKWNSEVGIYAVRIFKNNQWEVVTIDDLFPCMDDNDELKDEDNKGSMVGHSNGMKEIWVSLLEKAYAKYYGSYEFLEEGFVHHALKDLTGCETECISLSSAARGGGKKTLWRNMMRWRENGYILGCGSHPEHVKFAFDTGIVPNEAYTIYDVMAVDGHKLLKLRNPPGDHEEWKGDWSDKSMLWTKRLKMKLKWTNEDDSTFWMAFDDFCEIFREIYVCKWFDKNRWKELVINGEWEIGGKSMVEGIEVEKENTAVGLPNIHNSGCKVENNPQWSLEVDRPTEIRLKIEQVDANSLASSVVHPCAIYICKPHTAGRPSRVKELTKKNVLFSTGLPKRERNQEIYCTLQPGIYVILAGTYVAGMDGPFRISILSNYELKEDQIWPPTWRADDPDTFAGKMALKIANKVGQAADQAAAAAAEAKGKMDKAGGLFGGDGELELTEEEKEMERKEAERVAAGREAAKKKAMDDALGQAGRGEL